ncbi:DUF2306 domain-containing protein [Lysinibacillus sp. G4S2]|uniref:DUF2306 domain-containing protein n=1 Tax=Lysinibacillus sp. G4S2 TaxID=3055859 RepID=UPI0025A1A576|nr:DUF2306 domain-containing protein [Lysinibacillus sp. G4S2]MDM5249357.1 DUF2306 domain-containing protein [Lysinibacillus sp. G4S2]
MNKKTWLIFSSLAILISGYSIFQYLIMDAHQAGFVKLKLMYISTLNSFWYTMLYIHIVFSVVALVIGPFTLFSKFREKNINRHRMLGKIYMIGILFGGASGLYLAFYATGGLVSQLGFGFLAIIWMITASQALVKIKHRKIYEHQKWMIRNYSLTFAAVTLRIWLVLFTVLFGFENFNLSYAIIAWLCWLPNLIVAELLIHRNRQVTGTLIK